MTLSHAEFTVLRQTIATRGTVRMTLLPVAMIGWAAVATMLLLLAAPPIAALFSLAVLVGGFEAIHALHVGVERIGRYLQVHYETGGDSPRWETTAMAVGPALPGGGIDPLFTLVFASATIVNLLPALLVHPTLVDTGVLAALHLAVVVRLLRARLAAARQRAVELETFRALLAAPAPPLRP